MVSLMGQWPLCHEHRGISMGKAIPTHPLHPPEQVGASTTSHGLDTVRDREGRVEGCGGKPVLVCYRHRESQARGSGRH